MFQRILIPTDGSTVARTAVTAGIALAKQIGATVIGYYAVEAIEGLYYAEGRSARPASFSTAARLAHSVSVNRRERVRKRRPSGPSSENIPPRPGTTSMIS
jgi:nucleotide-binding universal stress UspA family protein